MSKTTEMLYNGHRTYRNSLYQASELIMKKFLVLTVAIVLFSPSAMAIHTCGQILGSCLVHIDPIVLPIEKPQKIERTARPIQQYQPMPGPRPTPPKCFKQTGQGLVEIPCPHTPR